ncbi:DUF883 domain-containing protein [Colwellia sp. E2M01]|uniref:DUF883 domain-containing protein n=1 Tax=Colwellia sp. E2M01 TaxID=2841561 RepID=UPI001C0A3C57|nr:DUF883 domain-containing protein [Colwellia sp. E2M01]MBU2871845.1 DUF883 domain-containing protein [Colwellia sp. E2M01]
MTTAKDNAANKTKKAKDDTVVSNTPIADNVTEKLHHSVDTLGEHAATAETKIRETAAHSTEAIADKQIQFKQYWDQSEVGKYAKENPLATAGIAFAAGMLLSSFLRKK